MRGSRFLGALVPIALSVACLAGCAQAKEADFGGAKNIAELSTMEYTLHNVATIKNDGTNLLFGINVDFKRAWFEYDGKVRVGIDASKLKISQPDSEGVVRVSMPKAQVLGTPDADEKSFSDVYCEKGLLATITTYDKKDAMIQAQKDMVEAVEGDSGLMDMAEDRAKVMIENYVKGVGKANDDSYSVEFVEAK